MSCPSCLRGASIVDAVTTDTGGSDFSIWGCFPFSAAEKRWVSTCDRGEDRVDDVSGFGDGRVTLVFLTDMSGVGGGDQVSNSTLLALFRVSATAAAMFNRVAEDFLEFTILPPHDPIADIAGTTGPADSSIDSRPSEVAVPAGRS